MSTIQSLTLEVADPAAAERFYEDAFGTTEIGVQRSDGPVRCR
jgi:catechol 2,3-dioxygenase-like lactoylglutathione lyase family enzyme